MVPSEEATAAQRYRSLEPVGTVEVQEFPRSELLNVAVENVHVLVVVGLLLEAKALDDLL